MFLVFDFSGGAVVVLCRLVVTLCFVSWRSDLPPTV